MTQQKCFIIVIEFYKDDIQLLKNENRAPSSERNGVIERRLSGSSHGAAALADGKTPIDQLNSMVSNFKMTDQPKPSTSPPSVKGSSFLCSSEIPDQAELVPVLLSTEGTEYGLST